MICNLENKSLLRNQLSRYTVSPKFDKQLIFSFTKQVMTDIKSLFYLWKIFVVCTDILKNEENYVETYSTVLFFEWK